MKEFLGDLEKAIENYEKDFGEEVNCIKNNMDINQRVQERIKQAKDRDIYGKAYFLLVNSGSYRGWFVLGDTEIYCGECHVNPKEWRKKAKKERTIDDMFIQCYGDEGPGSLRIYSDKIKRYCKIIPFNGYLTIEWEKNRVFRGAKIGTIESIEAYIPGEWEKYLDDSIKEFERMKEIVREQEEKKILEERIEEQKRRDMQNPLKRDWGF